MASTDQVFDIWRSTLCNHEARILWWSCPNGMQFKVIKKQISRSTCSSTLFPTTACKKHCNHSNSRLKYNYHKTGTVNIFITNRTGETHLVKLTYKCNAVDQVTNKPVDQWTMRPTIEPASWSFNQSTNEQRDHPTDSWQLNQLTNQQSGQWTSISVHQQGD